MSTSPHAQDQIDLAHAHLEHAALSTTDVGFAPLIRLTAGVLPPARDGRRPVLPGRLTCIQHLTAAEDALDEIAPLDGPPDLQLCAWHIHELRRIASTEPAA